MKEVLIKSVAHATTGKLSKVERDQYNGSKRRRKPVTALKLAKREIGVAKILALLQRATQGRVLCNQDTVNYTLLRHGI